MPSLPTLPRASANAPERLGTSPREGACAHAQGRGGGGLSRARWRWGGRSVGMRGRPAGTGPRPARQDGAGGDGPLLACVTALAAGCGLGRGNAEQAAPGGLPAVSRPAPRSPSRRAALPARRGSGTVDLSPCLPQTGQELGFLSRLLARGQLEGVPQQQALPRAVA